MQLIGLARLGRDAECRAVSDNTVANLSLAFSYYDSKSTAQNKRSTTWVDAALWGKQASGLEPYLKSGTMVCVTVEDLHIEKFQGRNGEGHKLVGRVTKIELAGRSDSAPAAAPAPAPQPAPRRAAPPAPQAPVDDDIPF